jgi:hypothetical protein
MSKASTRASRLVQCGPGGVQPRENESRASASAASAQFSRHDLTGESDIAFLNGHLPGEGSQSSEFVPVRRIRIHTESNVQREPWATISELVDVVVTTDKAWT